jgi:hypothetical protein
MAKALLGFATSTYDPRLVAEVRALRIRVRDLEAELDRSHAENALLSAALETVPDTLADEALTLPEPAYT